MSATLVSKEPKKIFTSGEIARILGVTRITVNRWVDSKKIRGYTLPNSGDRRITLENLLAFVRQYNLPVELLQTADEELRSLRGVHVRSADRKAVALKTRVQIRLLDGTAFDSGEGFVRDLNAGGAFLADLSLRKGALPVNPFILDLEIQDGALKGLKARGQPVRMSVGESSVGFGLQFVDLDDGAKDRIRSFVNAA